MTIVSNVMAHMLALIAIAARPQPRPPKKAEVIDPQRWLLHQAWARVEQLEDDMARRDRQIMLALMSVETQLRAAELENARLAKRLRVYEGQVAPHTCVCIPTRQEALALGIGIAQLGAWRWVVLKFRGVYDLWRSPASRLASLRRWRWRRQ